MNDNQIVDDISKLVTKAMLKYKKNHGIHTSSYNAFTDWLQTHRLRLHKKFTLFNFRFIKSFQQLFPNEARLRNLTYSVKVVCDLLEEEEEEEENKESVDKDKEKTKKDEKAKIKMNSIVLFYLPIMLRSNLCETVGLPKTLTYNLGECLYDEGGYFIIDGKERMFVPYETEDFENAIQVYKYSATIFAIVRTDVASNVVMYDENTDEIHVSVVEDYECGNDIPLKIPYAILMRALGIVTDKAIVEYTDSSGEYEDKMRATLKASSNILTQREAIKYIEKMIVDKPVFSFLTEYCFSNIYSWLQKALMLGRMVCKIFNNRHDNETRIICCGQKLQDHFLKIMKLQKNVWESILVMDDENGDENKNMYKNCELAFEQNNILVDSFQTLFKSATLMDLDRTDYYSFLRQMSSIHKHENHQPVYGFFSHDILFGISTYISLKENAENIQVLIEKTLKPIRIEEIRISKGCEPKLIFNGVWIGCIIDPLKCLGKLKLLKRLGVLHFSVATFFDFKNVELVIWTDGGRCLRPLYYVEYGDLSFKRQDHMQDSLFKKGEKGDEEDQLLDEELTSNEKRTFYQDVMFYVKHYIDEINPLKKKEEEEGKVVEEEKKLVDKRNKKLKLNIVDMLFDNSNISWMDMIKGFVKLNEEMKGIIDYVDLMEQRHVLIAPNYDTYKKSTYLQPYEYIEIDPVYSLGPTDKYSPFFNHALPTHQPIKFCSVSNTNWQMRMDNNWLLHNAQFPLIRTIYEEIDPTPQTGMNLVVAVLNHATNICLNRASVSRGLFMKSHFFCVEYCETEMERFTNIPKMANVSGKRSWVDFDKLDDDGIIKINERVDANTVIIGRVVNTERNIISEASLLISDFTNNLSFPPLNVDHTVIIHKDSNTRLVKIRFRVDFFAEEGDHIFSRNGFLGVIDEIRDEMDMPFTSGIGQPDIIINPQLFLRDNSSSCVGCLKETFLSSICCLQGGAILINPFQQSNSVNTFNYLEGEQNTENQHIFYDGYYGNQMEGEIFLGICFFHIQSREEKNETLLLSYPQEKLISLGLTKTSVTGFDSSRICVPVNNVTGAIGVQNSNSCIEIPQSFYEQIMLLGTCNVFARFLTEESYLKNCTMPEISEKMMTMVDETKFKNQKNQKNQKLQQNLKVKNDRRRRKKMTKLEFIKQKQKNEQPEQKEIKIKDEMFENWEQIYEPEIQEDEAVGVGGEGVEEEQFVEEPTQQLLEPLTFQKKTSVPSEPNLPKEMTIAPSILDIEKPTEDKENEEEKEKEKDGKKTIVL
jgi:DNA-directed RNA polymerase II subunit RPB2